MSHLNDIVVSSITNTNLQDILDEYKSMDWFDASVAESRYKNTKGVTEKDIRDASVASVSLYLQDILDQKIKPLVKEYAKTRNINGLEHQHYHVVKYTKGQFFAEHTDATEEYPRKISVLFYLNDDYSGGTITFTKLNRSIKPDKGTVIIFPSSDEFSHSADPVQDGTKYVVVGFWS